MTYFTFMRHDEPDAVYRRRWHEQSGGVGTCPRRKLTYRFLGIQLYVPWKPSKNLAPEMVHIGDSWWTMVRGRAPNDYVAEMRKKRLRVFTILLTILTDHQKLKNDVNFVRHRLFDYRVSLMLEGYSFWTHHKGGKTINEEPPRFEIVAEWIARHIRNRWSFDIKVTDNFERCAFEFSFIDKADATKFMAVWR